MALASVGTGVYLTTDYLADNILTPPQLAEATVIQVKSANQAGDPILANRSGQVLGVVT